MSSKFSIKARLQSFQYAGKGIWYALRKEHNFTIQLIVAVIVVLAGFYFVLSQTEWLWIVIAIGFVLTMETVNTAVERLIDLNHPDYDEKAGLIKDVSAGAVLIASITAAIIGFLIFIPKIF